MNIDYCIPKFSSREHKREVGLLSVDEKMSVSIFLLLAAALSSLNGKKASLGECQLLIYSITPPQAQLAASGS